MADRKISPGVSGAGSIYNGMYGGGGTKQVARSEEESAEESALRSGQDVIELSRDAEREGRQSLEETDSELLSLMEKSNEQIKASAEQFKKMHPETVSVPSTIGLSLKAASQKLKDAGLGIGKVSQEYSENIPAGKIVLQVPSPGGNTTKQLGVTVVISKGPPPDQKYGKDRNLVTLRYSSGDDGEEAAPLSFAPGAEALISTAQVNQAAAAVAAVLASSAGESGEG